MDFKYNRKLGAVILVIVVLLGTAYGIAKNKNFGREPSKGAYYDDQAGVLSDKAIETIEEFNTLGKGTLLVRTVKTTSPQTCYEYTDELAYELSSQGKLSEATGMILVMAIEDEDFTFLYGGALEQLDGSWEALRDKYIEPAFADKDYSKAVIDFCNGLNSVLGKISGGSTSQNQAGIGIGSIFVVIIIIVLLFALFSGGRRGRRTPPPVMMGPGVYSRPRSNSYTRPRSGTYYTGYPGYSSGYSSNRSTYSSSNRTSYSGSSYSGSTGRSSSYSSNRSGFSGGSRVGFSGNSSSRSSSSSSRSFSSGRSSFSSSSRSFSGSRSGFSGGSRSGFSGGGRK